MMKTSHWLLLIFFAFTKLTTAQVTLPFKAQKEFYIYGNATVIGNTIMGKDAITSFNDISLTNDDIDMTYTDIDQDDTTFSSSSAILELPANHTKIKYAVLYWAATYSYERGHRQESGGQFLFQGKRVKNRSAISKIKFKLPGTDTYKNINGDIIFDGANDKAFSLNSPYVCQADVTKLLKHAKETNGEYTVANVTATQGFVSGGSAAGWLLYVVYEAPTKNPQYITTYNGFAHVGSDAVKVTFDNFMALEEGEINTSITLSALEGDSALIDDEILISNPVLKRMMLLSTNQRSRNNFFNSKITRDDSEFISRNPASINTLGFDIATVTIPNQSQPIIDNNTQKVDLIFNTRSDRFYLFFTAFQTEISKVFYEQQQQKERTLVGAVSQQQRAEDTKAKKARTKAENSLEAEELLEKKKKDKLVNKEGEVSSYKKPAPKMTEFKPKKEPSVAKVQQPLRASKINEEKDLSSKSKTSKVWVVDAPKKEDVFVSRPSSKPPKTEQRRAIDYSQETSDKPLPIWLKQKQKVAPKDDKIYRPKGQILPESPGYNSLALNRDNYEKLLTVEDYIYETQTFKRVLNQESTILEDVESGYYIIATLVYDFDEAIRYQNELKSKGVNSKIFKGNGNSYYVNLYNSDNFYDVFMLRKAFIKVDFLSKVWILNINIKKGGLKKI
ncbi:hypothetical protein [Bizionia paragorgiae]|uniref:Adhesin SprB n=1 Tax=Bizionia paragorgiae TaxID=283786 RepID=A0A1H3W312_BIZPA|nr:hypothetical protein [Bizionia paragorgiae]SDZ81453.1 hypothetical protein SAMN04487990_102198 [Bizionia paragorgiae]